MTKRREPLTYQHTLEKVATAIGWERAGALCGVTAKSVRNWSDHDCEHEIRMIDAERLDQAFIDQGGCHAPFHRLLALRLDIAAREAKGRDLVNAAGTAAKEAGDAVAALITLSAEPENAERRRSARKEVQESIDALTDSLALVDSQVGVNV